MLRNLLVVAVFIGSLVGCQKNSVNHSIATSTEVGNGGHGIWKGEKLLLYDLWESGVAKTRGEPLSDFAGDHRALITFFRFHVGKLFLDQNGREIDSYRPLLEGTARKFAELYLIDPILSLSLLEAVEGYHWIFQNERLKVLPVPEAVLEHDERDLVMLANRSGRFIYIDLELFNQMEIRHRMALIFHEVIYSFLPVATERATSKSGKRARQITALLFGSVRTVRLLHEGIGHFLEAEELPLRKNRSTNPLGYHYTSGFFTRLSPRFRNHTTPDENLIGPAALQLRSLKGDSFTFSENIPWESLSVAATEYCRQRSGKDDEFPKIVLVYQGTDSGRNPAYRINYQQFSERSDVKWHLVHQPIPTSRTLEVASYSDLKKPFFDPENPGSFLEEAFKRYSGMLSSKPVLTAEQECSSSLINTMASLQRLMYPELFLSTEP